MCGRVWGDLAVDITHEAEAGPLLIFGWRRYTKMLGSSTLDCDRCDQCSCHVVSESVTWLTLFFVPVIPLSKRYSLCCTHCRMTTPTTKQFAEELLAGVYE